jgi:hypothetical protein
MNPIIGSASTASTNLWSHSQLNIYHHRWFGSTPNLASASPSIHRNTREQSMRWSSNMIEHVSPNWIISFIGWQRINRLHIMMEELHPEEGIELNGSRGWHSQTTSSHQIKIKQSEGNSWFINLIDPVFDYLPNQLRFFLNRLGIR